MLLPRLEYGSLLSYSSRGNSAEIIHSQDIMRKLKADGFIQSPPVLMSQWVARTILENRRTLEFASFFQANTVLVPAPKSSLMREGSLWVPERLSSALVECGLGKQVAPMLKRVKAVPKAAWSSPEERPLPLEHFESMEVQKLLSDPTEILLVDDIVTRGSTLLGAASRLAEVFPKSRIRAFAAMRTVSNPIEFVKEYQPIKGDIIYRAMVGDTIRSP
jgi:predicted amidophosphoribosyltransferase